MKSSAKNIVLKSVDDIFQTEENRADAQRERVQEIPLDQLKPFRNHPFKVRDDQRMLDTVDSIREYGVLVPAIARPDPEGGYELISGHRRKRGCEMAGLQTMPVIIRDLDDDAAVLVMVDSNNNMHDMDTFMLAKWVFKTACAVVIVTNTWNIVMAVFDVAQSVVSRASGLVIADTDM